TRGVGAAVRARQRWPPRGGARAVRVVPAAAQARHRSQVRAAHQAGAGRVRPRLRARASAATATRGKRARDGAGDHPRAPCDAEVEYPVSIVDPIEVIDSHTEGEPTRVVISGWPVPPGNSVAERLRVMRERDDALRRGVVLEPRGHDAIVGALLVPPDRAEAVTGVVF